jgi:CBS domain-containing protein
VLAVAPFVETEVHEELAVGDVMVPQQLSARPETSLGAVSELMLAHNLAALPVVSDDNEVLGMVTDRELLRFLLPAYVRRVSAEGRPGHAEAADATDPHELPVRDVMDRSVLCVSVSQPLAEVASTMISRGADQLPVVRDGAFVGVLTKGNIIRRLLGR